ncbi:MAG: hypothetical protein CMF36_03160 [Leeuwenhoekiella sp.]|nr:hypothetical protein [Leeuwenhoekiella sp.]MBA80115.1 hypothetical protein [Leeuwenhoekiella sp.]
MLLLSIAQRIEALWSSFSPVVSYYDFLSVKTLGNRRGKQRRPKAYLTVEAGLPLPAGKDAPKIKTHTRRRV